MVLYEDRVFEEALLNPAMRTLISYLLSVQAKPFCRIPANIMSKSWNTS